MSKATAAPFPIHASDDALEDLERRLASTRWPAPADPGWTLGTDPVWLRDLVDYWRNEFDWRSQEDWLNATLPGQRAHVRGIDVHFSHRPGRDPAALPLLLLHGWPSSFVEMHRIVGPLSDPTDHGLGGGPRFDVVVGSLPGHGFSSAPSDPAFGADECADVFRDLMVDVLGYERFAVHGGDRGAFVATSLGHRHPEHVAAIHQTLPLGIPDSPPSAEERAWLEEVEAWRREEGGYSALQATRPLSLAYGLNDSPVGLAAWIVAKSVGTVYVVAKVPDAMNIAAAAVRDMVVLRFMSVLPVAGGDMPHRTVRSGSTAKPDGGRGSESAPFPPNPSPRTVSSSPTRTSRTPDHPHADPITTDSTNGPSLTNAHLYNR